MEIEDYTPSEPEGQPHTRRMEMLLGLALVAAVLVFVLFSYVNREAQIGHYHAGLDALNGKDPERAIAQLQASDGYLDSTALIETARGRIEDRNALYKQATDFASAGKWWQAARTILRMQETQSSYKESDALLARARGVNGSVLYEYLPRSYGTRNNPNQDSLATMQADGGDAAQIPGTGGLGPVEAVSPDGLSVVYWTSIPGGLARLFNVVHRSDTVLALPETSLGAIVQRIDFAPDGSAIVIMIDDIAHTFDVSETSLRDVDSLEPIAQESKAEYLNKRQRTLTMQNDSEGATEVMVSDYTSKRPRVFAIERGKVDGALFSKDQRYLLYRVCELTNNNTNFECVLKLADLAAQGRQMQTIAIAPNLPLSSYDTALLGEFTQDGDHILLTSYRGEDPGNPEASIYDIATGQRNTLRPDLFAISTGRGKRDVYVVGNDYLLDDYIPGLQSWVGENALGRTDQNLQRPTDGYSRIRSHWIAITSNNRFALSLNSHITESARYYRLSVTVLTWNATEPPDDGRTLFSTKDLPREWLPSTRILPDGYTLVTSATIDSNHIPDIRAYSLDADGESDVILASAARLLELFSFPQDK